MELISSKSCTCALYCFKIEFNVKNTLLLTFLYSSFIYDIHKADSICHLPPTTQSFILTSLSLNPSSSASPQRRAGFPWTSTKQVHNITSRMNEVLQKWEKSPPSRQRDDLVPTSRGLTRTSNYSAKTHTQRLSVRPYRVLISGIPHKSRSADLMGVFLWYISTNSILLTLLEFLSQVSHISQYI